MSGADLRKSGRKRKLTERAMEFISEAPVRPKSKPKTKAPAKAKKSAAAAAAAQSEV
jgi:hypothetical protein